MSIIDLKDKEFTFQDLVKQDELLSPEQWPGDQEIQRIVLNSTEVDKGDLFLAIPPLEHPELGLTYLQQAIAQQAGIIIKEHGTPVPTDRQKTLVIEVDNIRRLRTLIATRLFKGQPKKVVGVTGTNGKTSVTEFVRQLWEHLGYPCASLGTLGILSRQALQNMPAIHHTSPGSFELHQALAQLRQQGITHLAMECSSHGIHQHRLDGVDFSAAAFTNLSHDHLDYHGSMEAYFEAKNQLFGRLLPEGEAAVLNADTNYYDQLAALCKKRGMRLISYGKRVPDNAVEGIRLENLAIKGPKQLVTLSVNNRRYELELNFIGKFQVLNALAAVGLVIGSGINAHDAIPLLEKLRPVPGRLELMGTTKSGGAVYVDYAHTPDALSEMLLSVRPYVNGTLSLVFGAGGDRDTTKRPMMAKIAAQYSDAQIVTDDNPRTEDAAAIRQSLLRHCSNAIEIADRKTAITTAIERLTHNDACVIAGKGHETAQIVGTTKHQFSDRAIAREVIRQLGGTIRE
jgi:UDP-N-acetylmuramoyl-L-alanyl-D-glutamate--2,6-diaminopimelate ligase